MTTADRVSARFDNDGSKYINDRDERLELVAEGLGAVRHREEGQPGLTRLVFDDGSAIVTSEGGWDVEGDEPFSWRGCPA